MRKRGIVILTVLLFVGCRHRQQEDDVPVRPQSAEVTDTIPTQVQDTVIIVPKSKLQVLQQDTAKWTNLRLFTRKQRTIYSSALLVGEWQRGNEHEQYMADGSGRRWDTGDEVDRDEAQAFSWTMDSNLLTFEYRMTLGAVVLRQYVVTFVDEETLVYRDVYGDSYMWDKMPTGFNDHPRNPD